VKRKWRLRKKSDFDYIYSQGKRLPSSLLVLVYAELALPTTKIGFSVSKKIGKAVVRNRLKRRLRNILRQIYPKISPAKGIIFVARKSAAEASFAELENAVKLLLRQANLVDNKDENSNNKGN
jgi:ribonuclease P protein component